MLIIVIRILTLILLLLIIIVKLKNNVNDNRSLHPGEALGVGRAAQGVEVYELLTLNGFIVS